MEKIIGTVKSRKGFNAPVEFYRNESVQGNTK